MTRTAFALLAAFALAACDQSTRSSIPSGTEAPRLTVTVLTGTKAVPAAWPTVKVDWEYADSGRIDVNGNRTHTATTFHGSGSVIEQINCTYSDSVQIYVYAYIGSSLFAVGADSSKTVYCK